jgi:hypothetical protein
MPLRSESRKIGCGKLDWPRPATTQPNFSPSSLPDFKEISRRRCHALPPKSERVTERFVDHLVGSLFVVFFYDQM